MSLSLLDLLIPQTRRVEVPKAVKKFRFQYVAEGGVFKGTNDEVLGWNSRRPGWVGFLAPAGHRWYVRKSDLTPESLALIVEIIEQKDKIKEQKLQDRKQALIERTRARSEKRKLSILDGKEDEIRKLQAKHQTVNSMATALNVARGTLNRKLQKMEGK